MTDTAKALYQFWSSFGIPAYVENTVPDDAVMPYITYSLNEAAWSDEASLYARVWYRSTSFAGIAAMVDAISDRLDAGTVMITDSGFVALFKGANFAQYIPSDSGDSVTKCVYLNIDAHTVEV